MVDNLSKEDRLKTMRAVKSKETKIETKVTKYLWSCGVRYRKNVKDLFGKPDIAIKRRKIVVFIDSCYWHGCSEHCRLPASNNDYWKAKIERNMARDKEVTNYYKEREWRIIRIWEHDLKSDFEGTMKHLVAELRNHDVK